MRAPWSWFSFRYYHGAYVEPQWEEGKQKRGNGSRQVGRCPQSRSSEFGVYFLPFFFLVFFLPPCFDFFVVLAPVLLACDVVSAAIRASIFSRS